MAVRPGTRYSQKMNGYRTKCEAAKHHLPSFRDISQISETRHSDIEPDTTSMCSVHLLTSRSDSKLYAQIGCAE